MMIEDVIKKSILPLAFILFWFWIVSTIMKVSGKTDFLMNQIMEQEGITEELKSRDQMEWVRRANNVRSRVDEIILNELVYV